MKVLEFRDLSPEDSLLLTFDGVFDQQAALERELEPVIQALEEYADGWMPDVVEGKRRRKYSRAAIWKSLEEKRSEKSTSIVLQRTKWPALYMRLRIYFPPLPPELGISLMEQPLSFFAEVERCRKFVEMVRDWASRYPVPHASAHSLADRGLADSPLFGRDMQTSIRDGFDKIYEVFWLNVFGPKLVEAVGRERMLSTPAHRVEELPNGSVLLVLWPTAVGFASDEARLAQARAHAHLRPDLDFNTLLRTLRERSATLAPVEPRFHPDVAPLLSRVVDDCAIHERQRRIAELNLYQPPEPDEWLPASAALPSDVADPARAREHYDTLAEHLVALLHSKVPSIFNETPQSLTDVDYQFWHEDFPTVFERQNIDAHAVPAIGAYLGQVMVRNLGGQWIPRQKLEEAQVRVGDRVWLPFVRAWRYMRSRQSLLDSSLTQLYRVAERHRG
ncbi:hypothetical protein [Archangium lansingense]|uniref:Uncharacterized protein n=1 Tax=Archangium lansingense TaxID=2995310 RepID=A0ABT3ZW78_9BACT|nr:hypothetical protein [Archangium lansinium]MCY1073628.1 hypothetical protein [Archangium lansinium]